MLVFVDESGDSGMKGKPGTSPYFVITLVLFSDNQDAELCDAAIAELRKECGMDERSEFHFNKCSDLIRTRFLRHVAAFNFRYFARSYRTDRSNKVDYRSILKRKEIRVQFWPKK